MKVLLISLLTLLHTFTAPIDKVIGRFKAPEGYHITSTTGFGNWLGKLPLKPAGTPTKTFRGDIARTDGYTAAVIDMSVGKQDLQQCADAVMRLRAEYLYQQKKYADISFNFTSGFKCDYAHYAAGYRYGNNKWVLKAPKDYSYKTFLNYMSLVFSYAGTLSLEKELTKVNAVDDMKAGDIFIRGGSPGHCFIILAVAENVSNQRKFLIAQSFMPAQDIQLLKASTNGGWFSLATSSNIPYGELVDFKYLRRFKD